MATTALALPSAAALVPKPRTSAPPPPSGDIVEERQLAHVIGLDAAYFEGFTVMREAAGQDLSAPNLLAGSYAAYLPCRRALLRARLVEQQEHRDALEKFVPRNRFLLGANGSSEIMSQLPACSPVSTGPYPAGAALGGSYLAWRRALLANRFEKRRAALEDEMCRRFAAEAMGAALAAETAEAESAQRITSASIEAAQREPSVWRPFNHFDSVLGEEEELREAYATLGTYGGAHSRGRNTIGATAPRGGGDGMPVSRLFGGEQQQQSGPSADQQQQQHALLQSLPPGQRITALSFAARDGDCFAVATEAGAVYLCSSAAGVKWATLSGHSAAVTAMDWSSRGRDTLLLTVSEDRTARVWKVTMPTIVRPPPPPPPHHAATMDGSSSSSASHHHVSTDSTGQASSLEGDGGLSADSSSGGIGGNRSESPVGDQQHGAVGFSISGAGGAGARRPPSTPTRALAAPPPHHHAHTTLGGGGAHRSRSVETPKSVGASRRARVGGDPACSPAKGGYLEPSERAAELERARSRMLAEVEEDRLRREAARGPTVSGGGAYCVRTVHFDSPVSHVAWMPAHPAMFVCASVEEADLDLEAEAAEAEAEAARVRRDSHDYPDGDANANPDDDAHDNGRGGGVGRAVGGLLKKGLAGGMGVVRGVKDGMKAAGKTTMTAIEAVPVVGGAAKMTAALAKAAVTGEFQNPLGPGGAGGRRRERRGTLLVINAGNGRAVQSRLVRGTLSANLTKPHSYVTALAFSPSGHQLFMADARGLIHEYTIETDPVDAQIKPLKDHEVIFGEGGNVFHHSGSGVGGGDATLSGGPARSGQQRMSAAVGDWATHFGGGSAAAAAASAAPEGSGGSVGGALHLTSLFYRPYDSALRSPLLIGMDNEHRIRALTVPAPTTATEHHWRAGQQPAPPSAVGGSADAAAAGGGGTRRMLHGGRHHAVFSMGSGGGPGRGGGGGKESAAAFAAAAKTGARFAVGAMNAVTSATVTAVTLGAVSGDKLAVNLNLVPQAQELRDFIVYTSPASSPSSSSTSASSSMYAPSSASVAATGGHAVFIPCRQNDGLVAGGAFGDIFVFNPHAAGNGGGGSSGGGSAGGGGASVFAGLALGGRDAAVGAGIVPAQVVCRLSGSHPHNVPVILLAMNRDETILISADARGGLAAWRKVPLSIAEAEDAPPWLMHAAAGGRPSMSTFGLVSPGGGAGGHRSSGRLAALFESNLTIHSIGRAAAEEARRIALGHLGGARPPTSGAGGGSASGVEGRGEQQQHGGNNSVGRYSGGVGGGKSAGASFAPLRQPGDSRRGLPSGWGKAAP